MRLKNKTILITCGPTWVALDPVRVISNRSTGALGQMLARSCEQKGAKVTVLEGPVQDPLNRKSIQTHRFQFFDELSDLLLKALRKPCDIVIHAAAISDYRPRCPSPRKLSSQRPSLILRLIPTEKIIRSIKKLQPECFLVGFKLVDHLSRSVLPRTVRDLFTLAKCDLVVVNSSQKTSYRAWIIDRDYKIQREAHSRAEATRALVEILESKT